MEFDCFEALDTWAVKHTILTPHSWWHQWVHEDSLDQFRLSVADLPPSKIATKRMLVSDIAKTFDVLGWFLQRVWERNVGWDDMVPQPILDEWLQWRLELKCYQPRPYLDVIFPKTLKWASRILWRIWSRICSCGLRSEYWSARDGTCVLDHSKNESSPNQKAVNTQVGTM